ncbi:transposase [Candidatus Chloroploca sp. M-50]|uniref:Transposase n=1 Tax=Candidatus Chloroploca mongolica TaxID=2528176 RepID=A0ABS4DD59_9CHLR|nr:transposase [Candidatus Chloroploca mongolica]
MITLGDVFRRSGPAYRARWGSQLSSAQIAAMHAIEMCRTEALGGQVYRCPHGEQVRYASHSCRNRHCPTCQQDAAQDWLARQQDLLLPVPSFLVTFTLPGALRAIAFPHQAQVDDRFFRTSAAAFQQLAQDPRFLGGQLGMVGVVQTWTRDLRYHPHIHYLVPGGGLAADGRTWMTARPDFLVHVKPLAILVRAKLQAALRQTDLWRSIPAAVWRQTWVVDCRPVGSGRTALKYLAPYVFRVALSNHRILGMADGEVTFRSQDGETRQTRISTLPAEAFIERFLMHILPRGFVKVRSFGLFRVGARQALMRLRAQLILQQRKVDLLPPDDAYPDTDQDQDRRCPGCGHALRLERVLPRQRAPPGPEPVASCEQRH